MAKENSNAGDEELISKSTKKKASIQEQLLGTSDDELFVDIPDIDKDFETTPEIIESPTEVRVALETGGTNNMNPPPSGEENTGDIWDAGDKTDKNKKAESTEKKPEVKPETTTEKAGDIEIDVPKKDATKTTTTQTTTQTTNTPPPPPVNNEKEKFKVEGIPEPKYDNTAGPDVDIWDIDPKADTKKQADVGTGNISGGNNTGGAIEVPPETAKAANEGLANTGLKFFEEWIIGGIRKRALINHPKFVRDMVIENVRRDFANDFEADVLKYNARIENIIQLSTKEKQLIKHCCLLILEKYPMIAEGFGPEIQALIAVGMIVRKYYDISTQWKEAQLDLLDRLDERLARAPKETTSSQAASKPLTENTTK